MYQYTPQKPAGATRKKRIVGRGAGSGKGCTAGRGTKGQKARSGGGVRPGFEGGQMPLYRRIARRGFSNKRFRSDYQIVNVRALDVFTDGADVTRGALAEKGLVKNGEKPVKLLGKGDVSTRLRVMVDMVSAGAREKIVAAGGTVEPIEPPRRAAATGTSTVAGAVEEPGVSEDTDNDSIDAEVPAEDD